jgi:hypothetical protein
VRRRTWFATCSALVGFVLVAGFGAAASAATAQLINEPFTNTNTASANWDLPSASTGGSVQDNANDACLTASSVTTPSASMPVPGCANTAGPQAGLQLTTNVQNQEGGLVYGSSVPSSLGLDVQFDSYQYAPTVNGPADGVAFFLAASDPDNANASPITLGPAGGHLGYSGDPGAGAAGLTNAYLGVGLDVFGNYTSTGFDGTGCTTDSLPNTPESITVRGPGSGTAGYCRLATDNLTASQQGQLDSASATNVPVEVAVNPTKNAMTDAGGTSVPANSWLVTVTPVGGSGAVTESGSLPDDSANLPSPGSPDPSWVNANGVPQQLTFGWSASTGNSTDYHTISNVVVSTLNGTPPTLTAALTDGSGGTALNGQTVNFSASTAVTGSDESRQIVLSDTFPAGLTPGQASGPGWTCPAVNGQTVTCTHPGAPVGALPSVTMPAVVASPPGSLSDTVTVGSPDAVQATSAPDVVTVPAATALDIVSQPVDAQLKTNMTNPDNTLTHVQVSADVGSGGPRDTTFNGTVTLSIANNPGGAQFLQGGPNGPPTTTLTATAQHGLADFSPIVLNAIGFGYTLTASATGLSPATTASFDIVGAASNCASGQSCQVTPPPPPGQSAVVQGLAGTGNATITATYGGNVAPIHPCTGAVAGILTFGGDRQKVVTLTLQTKVPVLTICYGQPTPFLNVLYLKTTYFNPINQEYEGLLPVCLPKFTGPCVKSLTLTRTTETVVINSGIADPHIMT